MSAGFSSQAGLVALREGARRAGLLYGIGQRRTGVSASGLQHLGNVCEAADDTTYEQVFDGDDDMTIRVCRVCGARRVAHEDEWGRPTDREDGSDR